MRSVNDESKHFLPSTAMQRRRLHGRKYRKLKLPKEPTTMDFDIPEQLKYTKWVSQKVLWFQIDRPFFSYGTPNQDKILLADSRELYPGEDPSTRIIIFGPPRTRNYLHLVKHIYCDGTFDLRPRVGRKRRRQRILPDSLEEALAPEDEEDMPERQYRAENGDPSTNNYSESDNARLTVLMGVNRPGMWKFMLRLQRTYDYYVTRYQEFLGGQINRKKSTKNEKREEAIKRATRTFGTLTQREYLYAIVKATSGGWLVESFVWSRNGELLG
jgi:hypothetical protein